MSGFTDSILDGLGNLATRAQEQSPNFLAGVRGWRIAQDGSAEFNNILIRGATTTQGLSLYYSGSPAAGNLVASVAATAGTDAYGNNYVAGIGVYDNANGLFAELSTGQLVVGRIVSGVPDTGHAGTVAPVFSGSTVAQTVIGAPTTATLTGHAQMALNAGMFGAVPGAANAPHVDVYSDGSGTACDLHVAGGVVAIDRGSGALLSPETWHAIPLTNGWTNFGGGHVAAQYRLLASPPRTVEIIGRVSHAAASGTSQVATALPAGYIPASSQDLDLNVFGNTAGPTASPVISVDTSGVLTAFGLPTGVTSMSFGDTYSLDA